MAPAGSSIGARQLSLDQIGRGLRSAHYAPGPLAPAAYEGCVLDLHKYIARRLIGGEQKR
jgi:hypothetical protein